MHELSGASPHLPQGLATETLVEQVSERQIPWGKFSPLASAFRMTKQHWLSLHLRRRFYPEVHAGPSGTQEEANQEADSSSLVLALTSD